MSRICKNGWISGFFEEEKMYLETSVAVKAPRASVRKGWET